MRHATELGEYRNGLCTCLSGELLCACNFHRYMDYCIKGCHRSRRASVADNHRYHFILQSPLPPQSVYLTVIDNKVQLTDYATTCHQTFWSISATINVSSPIQCAIAVGVDVDSMNVSDHVEFDAPQTSYLGGTMAKRCWKGFH